MAACQPCLLGLWGPGPVGSLAFSDRQPRAVEMLRLSGRLSLLSLVFLAGVLFAGPAAADSHAIAMHGEPALAEGFAHFPHVNPDAPKGGELVLSRNGSFDSFNPFTLKGNPVAGLNLVFESLLARAPDEPFTLYGLLARRLAVAEDRSWIEFTLDERARFHDGAPVTADDVIFSYEWLREKGRPNHRTFYANVARAERLSERRVRFVFEPDAGREIPLIMGFMPVLPKAHYEDGRLERSGLDLPVGSGPYKIGRHDQGRFVTYVRDPDYWGRDLPVNRGRHNFDRIRYEYFRDRTAAFEAFKTGLVDVWLETDPVRWERSYDFPAIRKGEVRRAEISHGRAIGMYGFAFNTRRPIFADRRVRRALALAFDFESLDRVFFGGAYERTASFFENSELAGQGSAGPAERQLLAAFPGAVDPAILESGYRPPASDGRGLGRDTMLEATALLKEAGWAIRDLKLVDIGSGAPFAFEILVNSGAQQRLALAYGDWLQRLGIDVAVRRVEDAQYQQRLLDYDFDMILRQWGASLSPGNEQNFYWSSEAAEQPGTRNYPGIQEEAVDELIDAIVDAETREDLVAATRALDRVLLSGWYVVPLFYHPVDLVAYASKLRRPAVPSLQGIAFDSWWAAQGED